MSLNRASSHLRPPALLSWLFWTLWVLLPPMAVSPTASPANRTLLFDSASNGLRNCSCPAPIRDCDEALANIRCGCRTVPRSDLARGGLREEGGLTVWFTNPWVLAELLNGSTVADLRLSFCGAGRVSHPGRYLALRGLRRLSLYSAARGAVHPEQALTIATGFGDTGGVGSLSSPAPSSASSSSAVLHMSILDVSVLNGLSPLKAYSVSAPPLLALPQHFPHLPPFQDPYTPQDRQKDTLLTFIY
ncbi:uncharacterized protein C21orf62 [Esox lucius]|uniref:Uncharacterized protein n=1 Tax=Esox lucius TaxID=8010 RepID=A0AAY5L3R0_ESOLU|nr:uncharacterized protein C21orf62 [Esox lucius]XP_019897077.1 uncharacterized protein C21orf62 [Esox lucius]XP_019897078.1 uncharacterized protein C21orf62 [Esox lucius]XP_019897079.1 uncharacterized protein C21orf62 [Esox lucius]XP_019897080.1 uncharacterized protein C21orf62 [Esox lucius]XP_019897081.1 uncharacterized protein C21orf62 [Esox lucius]XP_019897082.1 uncharacterized protein C21orf62 [Esox lucius]XP_019897083.1 uncharacterized protein C21orf62 [Esox lucius]XP_019897084.1 unch